MHWHASPSCRGLGPRVILLCLAAVLGLAPVAASAQSPRPKARVSAVGPHGDVFVLTNGTVTVPFGTPDITLTATVSDATPPVTYSWMAVDSPMGSTFTFTGTTTANATVGSFSVVGRYVFTVDVTDASGGDSASVTVFVLPPPYVTAPGTASRRVARLTATNVVLGTTYAAAAGRRYKWREATSGDIASYTPFGDVTITPDGTVDGTGFSNAPTATATVPANRPAGRVYRFVVEVIDNGSTATSPDVSLIVNTPPTAPGSPTPTATRIRQQVSSNVTLSTTGSTDADNDTLQYRFFLSSSTGAATPPGGVNPTDTGFTSSLTASIAFAANLPAGNTYTFSVQVSDGVDTVSAAGTATVTINTPPTAPGSPTPTATRIRQQVSSNVTLSTTGSTDADNDTLQYRFFLSSSTGAATPPGGVNPTDTGFTSSLTASIAFAANLPAGNTYTFSVQARDSLGDTASAAGTATVTVNTPPANGTVTIRRQTNPDSPVTNATTIRRQAATPVIVDVTGVTGSGTFQYRWDSSFNAAAGTVVPAFRDFDPASSANFTITPAQDSAVFQFNVTVRDTVGDTAVFGPATATASASITGGNVTIRRQNNPSTPVTAFTFIRRQGSSNVIVDVSGVAGGTGARTYAWRLAAQPDATVSPNFTPPSAASSATFTITPAANGAQYGFIVTVSDGLGDSMDFGPAIAVVNTPPAIAVVTATRQNCTTGAASTGLVPVAFQAPQGRQDPQNRTGGRGSTALNVMSTAPNAADLREQVSLASFGWSSPTTPPGATAGLFESCPSSGTGFAGADNPLTPSAVAANFSVPGDYLYQVVVTDTLGDSTPGTVTVVVNTPPTVSRTTATFRNRGSNDARTGTVPVAFQLNGTDGQGSTRLNVEATATLAARPMLSVGLANYDWDLVATTRPANGQFNLTENGSGADNEATSNADAANFSLPGNYGFTVRVFDNLGDSSDGAVTVCSNTPPTLSAIMPDNSFNVVVCVAPLKVIRSTDAASLSVTASASTFCLASNALMYEWTGVPGQSSMTNVLALPANLTADGNGIVAGGRFTATVTATDTLGDFRRSSLEFIKNRLPVVNKLVKLSPKYPAAIDSDGRADCPNIIKSDDGTVAKPVLIDVPATDDNLLCPLVFTATAPGLTVTPNPSTAAAAGDARYTLTATGFSEPGRNWVISVTAFDGLETSVASAITIHQNKPPVAQLPLANNPFEKLLFRASTSVRSEVKALTVAGSDSRSTSGTVPGCPNPLTYTFIANQTLIPPAPATESGGNVIIYPNSSETNTGNGLAVVGPPGTPTNPSVLTPNVPAGTGGVPAAGAQPITFANTTTLPATLSGELAPLSVGFAFSKSGAYSLDFYVTDGLEFSRATQTGIQVDVPPEVTDTSGPVALLINDPATFTASATDADRYIGAFNYTWSLFSVPAGGGSATFVPATGQFINTSVNPTAVLPISASVTFAQAGEYVLKLTADDGQYLSSNPRNSNGSNNNDESATSANRALFPRLNSSTPLGEPRRVRAYKPPVSPGSLLPATTTFRLPIINLSTRLRVGTGDQRAILGFVVSPGEADSSLPSEQRRRSRFVIRVLGPSLAGQNGLTAADVLQDPKLTIQFNGPNPFTPIVNDDFRVNNPTLTILATQTTLAPSNEKEAAYVLEFTHDGQNNSAFTVIAEGATGGTGIALVEIYDATSTLPAGTPQSSARLINVSTRGLVGGPGAADQMIAGFVLGSGSNPDQTVIVRTLGPSLALSQPNIGVTTRDPDLRLALGPATVLNSTWLRRGASASPFELGAANDARFEGARFNVIQNTALQFFRRSTATNQVGKLISPDANNQVNELNDLEAMTVLRLGSGGYTALAADADPRVNATGSGNGPAIGLIEVYAIPSTQDSR